jgi:hypothetical protein
VEVVWTRQPTGYVTNGESNIKAYYQTKPAWDEFVLCHGRLATFAPIESSASMSLIEFDGFGRSDRSALPNG